MRDVELLARYLALRFDLEHYTGRMSAFLDESFKRFNLEWPERENRTRQAVDDFEDAVAVLIDIFGSDRLARKPNSRQLNKAIFDSLIHYAASPDIREAMPTFADALKNEYENLFEDQAFRAAIERDTAGVPNMLYRLKRWGEALQRTTTLPIQIPSLRGGQIVDTQPLAPDAR